MRIAVVGTGLMGAALAEAVLRADHETIVYNRSPEKLEPLLALGAIAASTPAEAIRNADATFLVLSDAASITQVLLSEEARAVLKGRKLINVATISPDEIEALSQSVRACGGDLAEVSVLAYPDHVRALAGQYILGCASEDEPFWSGIFGSIGSFIARIGEVGDASRGDLAFALTFVFNITASAFTAAMATKLNVPPEIIQHQLTANPAIAVTGAGELLPQMFARQYEERLASIDTVLMALQMGLPYAEKLGIPTAVIEGFLALYSEASRRGYGTKDIASVYEVLMEPSG